MILKSSLRLKRLACVIGILLSFFVGAIAAPPKPNVVLILTDDQGYADVGFHGSTQIPTPNIDRIAAKGVMFTQGYVTFPACGPSRAALITGRQQDRFGSSRNPLFAPNDSSQGVPLSEETLADALKRADYTSGILGKWHLGTHPSQHPLKRGFDEFFGFLEGGHTYFPEEWIFRDDAEVRTQYGGYRTRLMRNNGRVDETDYLTDALSREAVAFVNRHSNQSPFFLFVSYNAPHSPVQASDKYLARFSHIENIKRRTYAAMVSAVDDGVGRILEAIEQNGQIHNTLVIFLSDNGGPIQDNASDNTPLRGGKGGFYEGGIRVPFAMMWPDGLPAGSRFDKPVSSMDIFATAAALAGVTPKKHLDGVNLIPYVTSENDGAPHPTLFWRNPDRRISVIRDGDVKLIRQANDIQIYDLSKDTSESTPIDPASLPQFASLMEKLDGWEAGLMPPRYLGLMQEAEYNRQNPDRFNLISPFEVDTLPAVVPQGYELVWSDEFNTNGVPDSTKWIHEQGFTRNEELQWYQLSGNTQIKDGRLVIEARRETILNPNYEAKSNDWRKNRATAEYTAASIKTPGLFSFLYGIMEVRARIDTSMGSWPAIWTLGNDRRWPDKGEIDILEYYRVQNRATILANAAWVGPRGGVLWDSAKIPLSELLDDMPDWPERYHIWKMDWNEDRIELYLNNVLINTIPIQDKTHADGFNPFRQPHYILLNLAIGSNGGDPANTRFPITYEVDYVRVYQKP